MLGHFQVVLLSPRDLHTLVSVLCQYLWGMVLFRYCAETQQTTQQQEQLSLFVSHFVVGRKWVNHFLYARCIMWKPSKASLKSEATSLLPLLWNCKWPPTAWSSDAFAREMTPRCDSKCSICPSLCPDTCATSSTSTRSSSSWGMCMEWSRSTRGSQCPTQRPSSWKTLGASRWTSGSNGMDPLWTGCLSSSTWPSMSRKPWAKCTPTALCTRTSRQFLLSSLIVIVLLLFCQNSCSDDLFLFMFFFGGGSSHTQCCGTRARQWQRSQISIFPRLSFVPKTLTRALVTRETTKKKDIQRFFLSFTHESNSRSNFAISIKIKSKKKKKIKIKISAIAGVGFAALFGPWAISPLSRCWPPLWLLFSWYFLSLSLSLSPPPIRATSNNSHSQHNNNSNRAIIIEFWIKKWCKLTHSVLVLVLFCSVLYLSSLSGYATKKKKKKKKKKTQGSRFSSCSLEDALLKKSLPLGWSMLIW